MHSIDEDNIVTYADFDDSNTIYPWIGSYQPTTEKIFSTFETPKFSPSRGAYLQHHSGHLPLNDMDLEAVLLLTYTSDGDFITNLHPRKSINQAKLDLHPVFYSLRPVHSYRKWLNISYAFFQKTYFPVV